MPNTFTKSAATSNVASLGDLTDIYSNTTGTTTPTWENYQDLMPNIGDWYIQFWASSSHTYHKIWRRATTTGLVYWRATSSAVMTPPDPPDPDIPVVTQLAINTSSSPSNYSTTGVSTRMLVGGSVSVYGHVDYDYVTGGCDDGTPQVNFNPSVGSDSTRSLSGSNNLVTQSTFGLGNNITIPSAGYGSTVCTFLANGATEWNGEENLVIGDPDDVTKSFFFYNNYLWAKMGSGIPNSTNLSNATATLPSSSTYYTRIGSESSPKNFTINNSGERIFFAYPSNLHSNYAPTGAFFTSNPSQNQLDAFNTTLVTYYNQNDYSQTYRVHYSDQLEPGPQDGFWTTNT